MSDIHSISDFLGTLGSQIRVFDMGRRVARISPADFLAFESAEKPYPYPLLQQAWFAVLHWNTDQPDQHVVWFLKMPLDEQGLLVQVARDDFMRTLLSSGDPLNQSEAEGSGVESSAYAFTPKEDRMAVFHAKATRELGQEPSSYFAHAQEYLSGKLGYDQWSFVGLQGIADVVARVRNKGDAELLAKAIEGLPDQPLLALAGCLENQTTEVSVAESILARLQRGLAEDATNVSLNAALLRALALTKATGLRDQAVAEVLASPLGNQLEVLVSIGSRLWDTLYNEQIRMEFLESIAKSNEGQPLFNQIIVDLLYMPGMRVMIVEGFRHPDRSEALAQAIGNFMQAVSQGQA